MSLVEPQPVAAACYSCILSLQVLKGQGLKSGLGLNVAFLNGNVSDVIACGFNTNRNIINDCLSFTGDKLLDQNAVSLCSMRDNGFF